jgi:hypothetical protein
MESTEIYSDVSILSYLSIPPEKVDTFCEVLHEYTGGLPRLVHKALEGS